MGTKIEWADETWSPVTGCTKVSAGCKHCYAERMTKRLKGMGVAKYAKGFNVTCHEDVLEAPLHWKKPRMVFVCSMSDLFHPDVPFEFIDKVFAVMTLCPQHTFQVLTKRPKRMAEYLLRLASYRGVAEPVFVVICSMGLLPPGRFVWPIFNVWLGTSCEDQATADERIPHLLRCPAAARFLSLEPLLGPTRPFFPWCSICGSEPTDYSEGDCMHAVLFAPQADWVIVGGESGPGARLMHPQWVRDIRDQCVAANVPFFFKQWGGVNKKKAGRLLDGRTWDEMPRDC